MKNIFSLFLLIYFSSYSQGNYAPCADSVGTTAMYKDSSAFVDWAKNCIVTRGYQNILDPSLGYTTIGSNQSGIGMAGDHDIVSLGDGGNAILTFNHPIINEIGADFAVFENSFSNVFLELAFVEVSSNGIDFVRFPSHSQTPFNTQIGGFDNLNPKNIHNLAGKYKVNYGTPFDLEDLIDSANVDINNITHLKIIDVIGIVNASQTSYDSYGNQINDPFPTPYPSSGFDLDGVGVIHQFVGISNQTELEYDLFPNPSNGDFKLQFSNTYEREITLYNTLGNKIKAIKTRQKNLSFNNLSKGFYILNIRINNKEKTIKVIIN